MATISSHTLNSVDGSHAGGVSVTLVNIDTGTTLFSTHTDDAGRLQEQVSSDDLNPDHRYELTFYPARYWADQGIEAAHCIDEIVLRFKMPDPDARYHMPIILSPNGYSTWASVPESNG